MIQRSATDLARAIDSTADSVKACAVVHAEMGGAPLDLAMGMLMFGVDVITYAVGPEIAEQWARKALRAARLARTPAEGQG